MKLSVISAKHHGCPVRSMDDMKKSTASNRKKPKIWKQLLRTTGNGLCLCTYNRLSSLHICRWKLHLLSVKRSLNGHLGPKFPCQYDLILLPTCVLKIQCIILIWKRSQKCFPKFTYGSVQGLILELKVTESLIYNSTGLISGETILDWLQNENERKYQIAFLFSNPLYC